MNAGLPIGRQRQYMKGIAGGEAGCWRCPRPAKDNGDRLVVRDENSAPERGQSPIAFKVTWRFSLNEAVEQDVALIQRVSVVGHKTLSLQGQTNYWEFVGTIPTGKTDCPNVDTWDYPGEPVLGPLRRGAHATLMMKGHVYAYELTPTLKEILEKWRRHRSYEFGATTWTAGKFPSNSGFAYKNSQDANLIGQEATTTVLKVEFKTRRGNTLTVSNSSTW